MASQQPGCHVRWLAIVLVLCTILLHGVDCQWTLQDFAQNFCNTVAQSQGVQCTCVDTVVISGEGNNPLCGYREALGPGVTLLSTTLLGWSTTPSPSSAILLQSTCDARNSETNTVTCTQSGVQSIVATTTTTITVGTGLLVKLKFPLDGGSEEFNFSFQEAESTAKGNTVSATSTCGPGGQGQPAGSCQVYTESYLSFTVPGGTEFTYAVVVNGGVQMSFSSPIDATGAIGQGGDGSTHYYWYFPINMIVSYAKSLGLPHSDLFDDNYPTTFQGSGSLRGQFLDVSTVCSTSVCP